jgi:cobalt-zinc-cadmium efflux system membrane fusion protein
LVPVRAKQSGVLSEQRVALGEVISAGSSIGLVTERGKFWVEARVRENELSRISVGQHATLSADGQGLSRTQGTVIWVAASVDPATRMGRVRIQPEINGNPLYAHQFVEVAIEAQSPSNLILVARDAVQWEGCCNVVFVSESADRFRPRKVNVLFSNGMYYAVSGVRSGERIVTKGSYLLKTELMKDGLGAGCCGVGA